MVVSPATRRALALAARAHALEPDNLLIGGTYGWLPMKAGRPERALSVLRGAQAGKPENRDIAYHLADAYVETGNAQRPRYAHANVERR